MEKQELDRWTQPFQMFVVQCSKCSKRHHGELTCSEYPNGIPKEITSWVEGYEDHIPWEHPRRCEKREPKEPQTEE